MGAALAWDGENAVGLVHHIRHRSCWTVGDYLYLQDLFVSPEARGNGIGRKLIEYVYELGRAEGCARVHWLTHESNTDAMLLYDRIAERSGFVQYRRALKYARHRARCSIASGTPRDRSLRRAANS